MEIKNRKEVKEKIVNLEQLAKGTGARYLECIKSPLEGILIASQWRRVIPSRYEILIDMEGK